MCPDGQRCDPARWRGVWSDGEGYGLMERGMV